MTETSIFTTTSGYKSVDSTKYLLKGSRIDLIYVRSYCTWPHYTLMLLEVYYLYFIQYVQEYEKTFSDCEGNKIAV